MIDVHQLMWVTQCHKPPKFGIGLYIPPIIHPDDWGVVYEIVLSTLISIVFIHVYPLYPKDIPILFPFYHHVRCHS